jgi:NAD(P)-dependent dehydrogenase (short-subunit alcohol dehydrogenase family)
MADGPDLHGRVAVVTGASRGLGAGMAARFAMRGLDLGLCARTRPDTPDVPPSAVLAAVVDVTDPDAVDHFCDAVVERFGRIDLWVNNAGLIAPIAPLRDADPGELRANVEVNLLGVLYGSAAFARHVRRRPGGGVLINISSGAATKAYEGWAAYCATKAAVDHATRVVAAEEAGAGLRAYAVAPGVVDTAMQDTIRATPVERFPAVDRFHEMKRTDAYNSPAWVADHILGLAFDPTPDAGLVQRVPDEPTGG